MRTRLAWLLMLALVVGLVSAGSVSAADQSVELMARLTGTQEVPQADVDGSAKAIVDINVDAGTVCFDIKNFKDTGAPNRGHIHKAAAGANGPIVVPFFELVGQPADPRNDQLEEGRISDCVTVADHVLLADIVAHPDQYYVNVHNARFPGGSMRCQLEPRD